MEAVGGRSTYLLGGAFNCGKGQPGQVAPVSHGCPSALSAASASSTPARSRADERRPSAAGPGGGRERLAAARAGSDDCVVIVEETSEAEVRFANNTTTTNGLRRDRRVTVIGLARPSDGGVAVGVARRGGDVDVAELVAAAERRRRAGLPGR